MKGKFYTGAGGINIYGVIEQAKAKGVVTARGLCKAGGGDKYRTRYAIK